MTREEATRIADQALAAADAINGVEHLVRSLAKEDRLLFADHLGKLDVALHFGILSTVYDRFPDLRNGQEERPHISSSLRWKDASLPNGVSEDYLDDVIFSVLSRTWKKTAMIIARTHERCAAQGIQIGFDVIGARIVELWESERIEGAANVSKWRHSEVRLKAETE
jgi:hypothetical protein